MSTGKKQKRNTESITFIIQMSRIEKNKSLYRIEENESGEC